MWNICNVFLFYSAFFLDRLGSEGNAAYGTSTATASTANSECLWMRRLIIIPILCEIFWQQYVERKQQPLLSTTSSRWSNAERNQRNVGAFGKKKGGKGPDGINWSGKHSNVNTRGDKKNLFSQFIHILYRFAVVHTGYCSTVQWAVCLGGIYTAVRCCFLSF